MNEIANFITKDAKQLELDVIENAMHHLALKSRIAQNLYHAQPTHERLVRMVSDMARFEEFIIHGFEKREEA